ncbi:hypothetical protein [Streptomyces fradiae]|uniref:hypothetical protein n=1 Tax=Streptomyces fradiae TaxID=1906 RepID=UPI0029438C48|nr:hypothetical protein [Streptomyces fradiae]WOI63388.1 hypothetical protein RYQ63_27860 [Streptomyces fradiae]
MTTRQVPPTRERTSRIGVRPVDEVETAYRKLTAEAARARAGGSAGRRHGRGPEPFEAVSEGAADAYRWALARADRGPITGAPTGDVPDLSRLTAEADAAAVLLDDPVCPPDRRAYVRGVHDALAWLCGQSDEHAV